MDIEVWVRNEPVTYRVTISREEEEFSFPAESIFPFQPVVAAIYMNG